MGAPAYSDALTCGDAPKKPCIIAFCMAVIGFVMVCADDVISPLMSGVLSPYVGSAPAALFIMC